MSEKVSIDFDTRRRHRVTKRPLHACGTCGFLDVWGKDWRWYGSYRDIDDGEPVAKFCSDACQKRGEIIGLADCADKSRRLETKDHAG